MKHTLIVMALLVCGASYTPANVPAKRFEGSISIDVTDKRSVITRKISRRLRLRIVKERSVDHEHFGWDVEMVREPYRRESENLLYSNPSGHGADPSMIYAWQVAEQYYPNERELPARGQPYVVTVTLVNPRVDGSGPDAAFVSGTLIVSWAKRTLSPALPN